MRPYGESPETPGGRPMWRGGPSGTNGNGMEMEGERVGSAPSAGIPGDISLISQAAVPVPDSPSFSVQVPSSPSFSVQRPEPALSCGRNCAQSPAPIVDRSPSEGLTSDRLHELCSQRGYCRKDSKDVSRTRPAATDAADAAVATRGSLGGNDVDTSDTLAGERERAPLEGVTDSDIPTQFLGAECRAGDILSAFVADKEVAEAHVQWRDSDLKERIDAQTRKDPGVPFVMDGGGPEMPA